MTTCWVLEARGLDGTGWSEEGCGATGWGATRFPTYAKACVAMVELIDLGEGWTYDNLRVREWSADGLVGGAPG